MRNCGPVRLAGRLEKQSEQNVRAHAAQRAGRLRLWAEEDGSVVLGHRRLAIIDLSETGAQPMRSGSGRFVISFNGEIYNHKEIAGRLLQEGRVSAFREARIRRRFWRRRKAGA